jgi:excinuclease ABC subunit C
MIPQIAAIEALVLASEHEAAWAERMLLEHRKVRWNRVAGGLEVPVHVRVEAAVPRISVAHEVADMPGVHWYGPYLGGTATRLAVAGLERVYPMSYARAHLTGTERDLARIQGVELGDAAALVEAVDAVLRRDPAAVGAAREALVAKRDAAVSSELYEMASRIHDELGGLDWVVAPIRLFRADEDLIACADGMQVSLRFRSGRLRTWEQAPAPTEVVIAPDEWGETLRRNAALAAALVAHPVR